MAIRLYFSNNSIRNTTLLNESLGIRYAVFKVGDITTVTRRDRQRNAEELVGEFALYAFKKSKIRLGRSSEWQLVRDFLYVGDRGFWSSALSFRANDGNVYRWKRRGGNLIMTLDSAHQPALITYNRRHGAQNPSYLEISDPSLLGWFDNIILSFLIYEKKMRDAQKAAAASAGGGAGASGGGGG